MRKALEIINDVKGVTDSIILTHSLSGKDSIALLDLCYPHFKRIVCMFMYTVPNLRHIGEYYAYARRKYPNAEWVQVPHYDLLWYRKNGILGMEGNPKQRLWAFSDLVDGVRRKTGIEWVCTGFKQSDSLNRRLMLRSYKDGKEAINWSTKKFYPLSMYKNGDVLEYIQRKHLKKPESFLFGQQTCGVDITSWEYLEYLKANYPDDLEKVYQAFPATRVILINHENDIINGKDTKTKRNEDSDAFADTTEYQES